MTDTPTGATVLLALVIATSRSAAEAAWRRHLGAIAGTVRDAAMFAVLEGEGDFALLHDTGTDPTEPIEQSIREQFGSDAVVAAACYTRISASADSRPLSQSDRFVFIAHATVEPSIDHTAFNRWYDGTHVPDVAAVGLRRAQRYRLAGPGDEYLASYEIESPDVLTTPELARVRGFHQFTPSVLQLKRTVGEVAGRGAR
jgi:hypothetical protein